MITDLVVGVGIIIGAVTRGAQPGYAPSSPIAVAFCTASWRDETPSLR